MSPHKIQVTWKKVPRKFMNGKLLSYHVTYQRVMVGGVRKDFELELQETVSVETVTLENLEPYSKYKIRVAAKTAKGLGPYTPFTYGGKFVLSFFCFVFVLLFFKEITRILD